MKKYSDIKWDDSDEGFEDELFEQNTNKKQDSTLEKEDFAALFAASEEADVTVRQNLRVGSQVQGTIISIAEESGTVLVELDPQHTGVMEQHELYDESGAQKYFAGDSLNLYITSRKGGEILLSHSLSQSQQGAESIKMAQQSQLPIKGRVAAENPGGFDVTVLGQKCFCPVSQIDTHYVANKSEYVGKEFMFLVTKFSEGGRNILVSRSRLLEQETQRKLEEIESKLNEDLILQGTVKDLLDFGAIIDLGGLTGFLHVSEMSYSRVNKASDFLERGESVRVKVLSVEEKGDKKRVSLSMKAAQMDPWLNIEEQIKEGQSYEGVVTKLQPFGAFVSIGEGIEGLIHISEMSWEKRIHNPSDILSVGDHVSVRVLTVDTSTKRLSLSLKHIEEDPWQKAMTEFQVGSTVKAPVQQLKGFGAIVALKAGVTGLIPIGVLKQAFGEGFRKKSSPPKELEVVVKNIDEQDRKILLSLKELASEDDSDAWQQESYKQPSQAKITNATGSFGELLAAKMKEQDKKKKN